MEFRSIFSRGWKVGLVVGLMGGGELRLQAGEAGALPALAVTKAKAEAGDPVAQFELGRRFRESHDSATAHGWFRRAAMQGSVEAQAEVGSDLLDGRSGFSNRGGVTANPGEAIRWIQLAADQGNTWAMGRLGECYLQGKAVPRDPVKAYQWLKLAVDRGGGLSKAYLDRLILTVSQDEIARGQALAAQFVPRRLPVPPDLMEGTVGGRSMTTASTAPSEALVLKGISGNATNRLAILNNQTFAVGETRMVSLGGRDVKVLCREIGPTSVQVEVEGRPDLKEVHFRSR
jgi:hypothetical protein